MRGVGAGIPRPGNIWQKEDGIMKQAMKYCCTLILALIFFSPLLQANDLESIYDRFIYKMSNDTIVKKYPPDIDSLLGFIAATVLTAENGGITIRGGRKNETAYFVDRFPDCDEYFIEIFLYLKVYNDNNLKDLVIDNSRFDVELYPQSKCPNYVSFEEIKSAYHRTIK